MTLYWTFVSLSMTFCIASLFVVAVLTDQGRLDEGAFAIYATNCVLCSLLLGGFFTWLLNQ